MHCSFGRSRAQKREPDRRQPHFGASRSRSAHERLAATNSARPSADRASADEDREAARRSTEETKTLVSGSWATRDRRLACRRPRPVSSWLLRSRRPSFLRPSLWLRCRAERFRRDPSDRRGRRNRDRRLAFAADLRRRFPIGRACRLCSCRAARVRACHRRRI